MTATLEWEGIPAYVIGMARGISAVIGIAATVLYPILEYHISAIRTGLWSIWSQVQSHKWFKIALDKWHVMHAFKKWSAVAI